VCEQQLGGGGVPMDLISPAMRDYSAIRLSALIVLYFYPLKGIFLHGHSDSLLYTQFSRTRSYSISILYTNFQPWDPLAKIF
jgi:hypothetical protein